MGEPEEGPDQQNRAAMGSSPPRLAEDQFYRALASSHTVDICFIIYLKMRNAL